MKKAFGRAAQFLGEKVGAVKGTELSEDFKALQAKLEELEKTVDDLDDFAHSILQPDPTSRAKYKAMNALQKIKGSSSYPYPQTEGLMGEALIKHAKNLGEDDVYAQALHIMGEAYKDLAEVRYQQESRAKSEFFEPMHAIEKDLKEISHHRKKLESRRLDFDAKKRSYEKSKGNKDQASLSQQEQELRSAQEKFESSVDETERAMTNLLENEAEYITYLGAFASAQLEYHKNAQGQLEALIERLKEKQQTSSSRPRQERKPRSESPSRGSNNSLPSAGNKPTNSSTPAPAASSWDDGPAAPASAPPSSKKSSTAGFLGGIAADTASKTFSSNKPLSKASVGENLARATGSAVARDPNAAWEASKTVASASKTAGGAAASAASASSDMPKINYHSARSGSGIQQTPTCRALFDFTPENPGELGFKENDVIKLVEQLDENWYKGELKGKSGFFPINYVEVIVPLPKK